ncbi:AraC family transcriptional regulator [Rhodoferax sp.]|uniref:helix-turn-helix domain-containing protein n=1 Tax=Rhodoferax sp. TaxID=50421 RepID=UPI0025E343A2|nr:AraC family transcriptional regulator [Rhodoferax sp.]
MTPSPAPNTARLDRLSALLLAAAPRVEMGAASGQPNSLSVSLLANPGAAPHSLTVAHGPHSGAAGTPSPTPAVVMQVHLDGPAAPMLMREFAQPMELPLAGTDGALAQAVQLLCNELAAPRCGQPAMLASAGNMLFIGLLRHLVAQPQTRQGLFAGLSDPRIAVALVAMHEQPHTAWSLESLAERAGMSRTAFATRFKDAMGTPPGKYLAQLRLQIAQRAVQSGKGLKGAARASGYKDVSALSRALGRARSPAGGVATTGATMNPSL